MAHEIFISYRRSDAAGHARMLHRVLQEFFDRERLFFDQDSIESGENFSQRIGDAVNECPVLLALIARDWLTVEEAGERRLHRPNDVVRREIATALGAGKKVIPVLFDDAPLPQPHELPDDLAPLTAEIDVLRLGGKSYLYDVELRELVRLIAKVPGVSPPRLQPVRTVGGITAGREKLVYLCDRSMQDTGARDTIREQFTKERGRPVVLVVHGRVEELHQAFVERLQGFSLPRLLKGAAAPGIRFVDVFDALPVDDGQPVFDRRLREALADRLETDPFDDDRTLLDLAQAQKLAALVAVVRWRSSEVLRDPAAPLARLFDYWARFPDSGARRLVGCIACVKYDAPGAAGGGWLRRMFGGAPDRAAALRAAVEATAQKFGRDERVVWRVLPELPSLTVADLSRWVEEVEAIVGRLDVTEERLRAIVGADRAPMEKVLPELEKLIPQH